jgi:hypothetical protein
VNVQPALTREQRHKVDLIEHALDQSDVALHRHMVKLKQAEQSAKQHLTQDLSGQQSRILDQIQRELSSAVQRLDALDTGLQAQADLRQALIDTAAAFAAWALALRSRDSREIARARARMQRHFSAAAISGDRGTARLKRGV